jgi:hypothetical protein
MNSTIFGTLRVGAGGGRVAPAKGQGEHGRLMVPADLIWERRGAGVCEKASPVAEDAKSSDVSCENAGTSCKFRYSAGMKFNRFENDWCKDRAREIARRS